MLHSRIKFFLTSVLVFCMTCGTPATLVFSDSTPSDPPDTAPAAPPKSMAELKTMVAPIALYPDALLSQILVACTYPLEIVQANQWLQANASLQGQALSDAVKTQSWDASVQALVAFPDVLKRLNQDITWTTNLGNTFLAQQSDVMDAVQQMRGEAEQTGKLASTSQQKVINTTTEGQKVIEIEPTSPEVVYVPVYDPVLIWGPPMDYYYPGWYYPHPWVGSFYAWDSGISLSVYYGPRWGGWHNWGWHPYWHQHTVVVNNYFVNHYTTNVTHVGVSNVTNVHSTSVWRHEPAHRMGVAYPSPRLNQQFRTPVTHIGNNPGMRNFSTARPSLAAPAVQAQLHQSAVRYQSRPATFERMASHPISTNGYNNNRTAFGGMGSGMQTRAISNRGYTSLSHAQGIGNAHRSPSTGQVRGSFGTGGRGVAPSATNGGTSGGHRGN